MEEMLTQEDSIQQVIRVGLLVPSSNTVMEVDLYRNLMKDMTLHTARMYLEEATRSAEIKMIEEYAPEAAQSIKTAKPHFVVFGCTSAGSLRGPQYDAEVCTKISQITGVPTIGVFSAVRAALHKLKAKSVAVITPYIDNINASIKAGLEGDGLEVIAIHGMGINVNFATASVKPIEIALYAIERLKGTKADVVFFSCTNFRAMAALPLLKEKLSSEIITSNTATIEAIFETANKVRSEMVLNS